MTTATNETFSCSNPLAYGYDDRMVIESADIDAASEIGDEAFAQQVVLHWEGATTKELVLRALAAARN